MQAHFTEHTPTKAWPMISSIMHQPYQQYVVELYMVVKMIIESETDSAVYPYSIPYSGKLGRGF